MGIRLEGTGTRKYEEPGKGPIQYTIAVLERLALLSNSPILRDILARESYSRMAQLLKAGELSAYKTMPRNPGLIETSEEAVKKIAKFIEDQTDWSDTDVKTKGKAFYESWLRREIKEIAKDVGFKGNTEQLVEHIMWKAKQLFGWD